MYRIRAVCLNPACQAAFGVEFTKTGPLEAKTPKLAFELRDSLHAISHYNGVKLPEFIKCPKCHSLFPIGSFDFLVYDAAAQDKPALDMYVVEL